jgi:DNA-binding XRE family transcriptional regulator
MNIEAIRVKRGLELKAFRLEVGLTQLKLSELSGLTRSTIIKIETGLIGWNVDSEILYFETLKNHDNGTRNNKLQLE